MCSMTFVACGSSDDDDEGGSNSLVGGRWIELELRRNKFDGLLSFRNRKHRCACKHTILHKISQQYGRL